MHGDGAKTITLGGENTDRLVSFVLQRQIAGHHACSGRSLWNPRIGNSNPRIGMRNGSQKHQGKNRYQVLHGFHRHLQGGDLA